MSAGISTSEAYDRCEAITRSEAANFYYGIRLLARERRRAMCAAYAFARRIDDIGDGELPRERKLGLLRESAAQLALVEGGGLDASVADDPVLVGLADAHARFQLPAGALGELIEGVRMDVDGVPYEHFEELEQYCRRVAGAIGRVCLAIFSTRGQGGSAAGARPDTGTGVGAGIVAAGNAAAAASNDGVGSRPDRARLEALADDLGVALQLTNILRDVREDAENGRVYLPAEDLRRFAIPLGQDMGESARLLSEAAARRDAALGELIGFEAERAQRWFDRGMPLVAQLDRRSGACVSAMAGIYHRLLERIEADPARALSRRTSLSGGEKVRVALRSIAGRGL